MNLLRMYKFIIHKEENLIPEIYALAVEKLIRKNSEFVCRNKQTGTLRDIENGVFGVNQEIYEIKGEGVIVYDLFNVPSKYLAKIQLLGFNQESEKFKEIKNRLEEILKISDTEELKKIF